MIKLKFSYETSIRFSDDVTNHAFLLRCFPMDIPGQKVESMTHTNYPIVTGGQYSKDGFGNVIYTGRIDRSHDSMEYKISGVIVRDDMEAEYEKPMPCYKYPSELTYGNGQMQVALDSLRVHGSDIDKAHIIAEYITKTMEYLPGSTNVATTATEAFGEKKGVCQDFAHIMITMCRMEGIYARYVSGITVGEGETHAWVEVWQDGYWYGIDPTRGCDTDETYIKLCVGRDYNDCPVERGIFNGSALQSQEVFMKVSYEKEEEPVPA